jgi:hypothetical protein
MKCQTLMTTAQNLMLQLKMWGNILISILNATEGDNPRLLGAWNWQEVVAITSVQVHCLSSLIQPTTKIDVNFQHSGTV